MSIRVYITDYRDKSIGYSRHIKHYSDLWWIRSGMEVGERHR